jgi:hypothetical protein
VAIDRHARDPGPARDVVDARSPDAGLGELLERGTLDSVNKSHENDNLGSATDVVRGYV